MTDTDDVENASSVPGDLTSDALDALIAALYYGYSNGSVSWSSPTWTGVHNATALTDVIASGITKVDSTFTFAQPGTYLALVMLASQTAANHQVGVRMRDTVNNVTDFAGLININGTGAQTGTVLGPIVIAAANETRDLQYVKAGPTAAPTLATQTYNGQALALVQVGIVKVKPA